jgi:hypothetical protein
MAEQNINYAEMPTPVLIELLIQEEDRVTLAHIQELAARTDAVESLRAWMPDENRWREARDSMWWALYHAFTILSLTRRADLLDDLLQGYRYAYKENFDWLIEIGPAAFAQFGEAAVEPLIRFVMEQRTQAKRAWEITFLRSSLVTALARIALEHPAIAPRVAEFVCARFSDPEETNPTFLGSILGQTFMLGKERVLEPMRDAFDRGAVDESIAGDFEQTLNWFDPDKERDEPEYHEDLLEFYKPEEIADRQARWKRNKENEERRAKQKEADEILERLGWDSANEEVAAPAGYSVSESGSLIRDVKVGRNDPCPCGSGKKYKKCHGS